MKMVGDGEQRRELRRADTSVSGILYGSPIQFDRPHQFLNSEQSIPLFHPFRPQRIKTQSSRHGSQGLYIAAWKMEFPRKVEQSSNYCGPNHSRIQETRWTIRCGNESPNWISRRIRTF
ncbi:uncharacterized protein LOC143221692 isoform X2 [Lasioglossum baleicum]|uniref:uncharacterized protein LOC143221692 isoform X2 n=1 Tax=Lasioglossum baleicum TaxID=434251 RepID=UPI003FCC9AE6